jgi:hypothetical protein
MSAVIARSEATKQSSFVSAAKKLDCFASLAMTEGQTGELGIRN